MSVAETLLRITPYPKLSVLIWVFALLLVLYLARNPFRHAVGALTRVVTNALRLSAASAMRLETRVDQRNRDVLLAKGLQVTEQKLAKEFRHISKVDVRNLETYATLHHQISAVIHKLEDDHTRSIDVPPTLPNWNPIIKAIASIEHNGDAMVADMLSQIKRTLEQQHAEALNNYRNASKVRQNHLNKMLPRWRELQKMLGDVGRLVTSLGERAQRIDRLMDEYEKIKAKTPAIERILTSSSLTQFCLSGLMLLVAAGGVILNFHLLVLPMSEMVGAASYVGPYATAEAVAFVITLMELSLGLFLLESLRITRLVPIIGAMDEKARRSAVWICLALLVILAGIESSLALLRNQMTADALSLDRLLAGVEASPVTRSIIPTAGHMIMGFVLPFWMAASALPLVSFLTSARTVLGILVAGSLRFCVFLFRLVSNVVLYASRFLVTLYDMLIFPTLWLEGLLGGGSPASGKSAQHKPGIRIMKKPRNVSQDREQKIEYNASEK